MCFRVVICKMGSSKKHKDKNREHRHKHRKHKSRDRSRSRSRGRRLGDDDQPREKNGDRKRHRDEREQYYEDEDVIQTPVEDGYDENSAAAAHSSSIYTNQKLTDEGYLVHYCFG